MSRDLLNNKGNYPPWQNLAAQLHSLSRHLVEYHTLDSLHGRTPALRQLAVALSHCEWTAADPTQPLQPRRPRSLLPVWNQRRDPQTCDLGTCRLCELKYTRHWSIITPRLMWYKWKTIQVHKTIYFKNRDSKRSSWSERSSCDFQWVNFYYYTLSQRLYSAKICIS